jgi:hypothetical protein
MKLVLVCAWCGKEVPLTKSTQVYCSRAHKEAAAQSRRLKRAREERTSVGA